MHIDPLVLCKARMNDIALTALSIFRLGKEKELPFLAGSIAFFAFLSLVPALLLVLAIGSVVGGESFANWVVGLLAAYLSEEGTTIISDALSETTGFIGASIVGFAVLFWSVFRVFRAIDIAFDRIYGAEVATPLPRQLFNGAVVTVTIGSGLLLFILVRAVVYRLDIGLFSYLRLVSLLGLLVGLLFALVPLYYVMPPRRIPLRDVLPGTFTTVVGLLVLDQVFQIYTSVAGQYLAYGFLGAVLLFLLWLYFGSLVVLFGAVVNAALANRKLVRNEP